jgi:hypothetical protein
VSAGEEPKVLRALVDEVRAEPVPEPRWDALEAKLLARLDEDASAPAAEPAPPRLGLRHAVFAVAAAAAIVAGVRANTPQPTASHAAASPEVVDAKAIPRAPGVDGALDLLAVRPGDVLETSDASATFAQAGSVRFTLAPSSRAVVRAIGRGGVGHVIALESGSLRAEVTPRAPSEGLVEAFAVEAGGTRVAVHGTAFTVTRTGDQVLVDVEHGAVAVGPVGHVGDTNGHLLVGPARASFSLDGGRTARFLPREKDDQRVASAAPAVHAAGAVEPAPSPVVAPPAREPVAPPPEPHHAASPSESEPIAPAAPPPTATASQPPAPAYLTAGSVRGMLARCFDQTYGSGPSSVRLSIASTFRITLRADGSIQAARFDPPLEPAFQSCAGAVFSGRFAPGSASLAIPIAFAR